MHDSVLDIASCFTVSSEDFLKHRMLSLKILLHWTSHVTVPLASAGNYNSTNRHTQNVITRIIAKPQIMQPYDQVGNSNVYNYEILNEPWYKLSHCWEA
jgi:hypothetical protein